MNIIIQNMHKIEQFRKMLDFFAPLLYYYKCRKNQLANSAKENENGEGNP